MLRALVRNKASGATGVIYDPQSARPRMRPVGATVTLDLGGKSGIPGDAPYRKLSSSRNVRRQIRGRPAIIGGRDMDMGPSACLRIGDIRVVVGSYKAQLADQSMYRYVGIEPTEQKILVNKSSVHFRADFEPIAEKLLICAAPCAMPADTAHSLDTAASGHPHQAERPCLLHPISLNIFSHGITECHHHRIDGYAEELTAIRRDLHAHPEIGFEEVRTSGIVAEKLKGWGIEVHRLGGTGVIGVLKGKGSGTKRIGLRADMDALPMEENTNLKWRSTIPAASTAAAATAIPPCCSAPRAIWPRRRISTAPCISSSSPPRKASARAP